jgi:hypothetical protein
LYFIAITLLRSPAPCGSAGRRFAQRYGVVALAASCRARRDLYRQRERAFTPAMAGRPEWEHAAAISGAWPSSATPDRAAASPAKGRRVRSGRPAPPGRPERPPVREGTPCDRCQRVI